MKSCQGPGLKRPKWVDTSQHGNREPFRNETLDGAEYQISSDLDITNGGAARQHVPSRGTLVFDMVEAPHIAMHTCTATYGPKTLARTWSGTALD